MADVDEGIVGAVKDQSRRLNRRQHWAHIDLGVHPEERLDGARGRGEPLSRPAHRRKRSLVSPSGVRLKRLSPLPHRPGNDRAAMSRSSRVSGHSGNKISVL